MLNFQIVPLIGLLLDLCIYASGQGVITLVTPQYQVSEGEHFNVDVMRSGVSGSDVVVIAEVSCCWLRKRFSEKHKWFVSSTVSIFVHCICNLSHKINLS